MSDPIAASCLTRYMPAYHTSGMRELSEIWWIVLHDEEAPSAAVVGCCATCSALFVQAPLQLTSKQSAIAQLDIARMICLLAKPSKQRSCARACDGAHAAALFLAGSAGSLEQRTCQISVRNLEGVRSSTGACPAQALRRDRARRKSCAAHAAAYGVVRCTCATSGEISPITGPSPSAAGTACVEYAQRTTLK